MHSLGRNLLLTVIVICRFVSISPLEEPTEMGEGDNIFITKSLDATSHVETIVEDVRDVSHYR